MYGSDPLAGVLGTGGGVLGTMVAGFATGRLADTGWPILAFAVAGVLTIVCGVALLRLSWRRSVR